MTYRSAVPADAPAIAALHAASWQVAYRGDFSDHYLDVDCPAERLVVWRERFRKPDPGMVVTLAEEGNRLRGFCCTFLDYDEQGSYLDNLHVAPDTKGQGIGKALLQDAIKQTCKRAADCRLYLWVLTSNQRAIGFYEYLGGRLGNSTTKNLAGNAVTVVRISWP